eukprot:PhM_4_TR936/c0_g1_i1/m.87585
MAKLPPGKQSNSNVITAILMLVLLLFIVASTTWRSFETTSTLRTADGYTRSGLVVLRALEQKEIHDDPRVANLLREAEMAADDELLSHDDPEQGLEEELMVTYAPKN